MLRYAALAGSFLLSVLLWNSCGGAGLGPKSTGGAFAFTPASGAIGTLITVSGVDLSTFQSLSVGGVPAVTVSATSSAVVAMVMPGTVSSTVSVTTAAGTLTSLASFAVQATGVPSRQQATKLIGSGVTGLASNFAESAALSADGNTALIGSSFFASSVGGVWPFVRTGTTWAQQGAKLVGTGITGAFAGQGHRVALSADGNTAIIGAWSDNNFKGAAWIFVRSGTTWTQQGTKLIGSGGVVTDHQGSAVAISADGNTAVIGARGDYVADFGGAWIFTRSGTTWTQQGSKLVGSGSAGGAAQGDGVALSADGNTALIGGPGDSPKGATWVFTRSGTTWTQQGAKLVGSGAGTGQGFDLDLSADGNTALIGAPGDRTTETGGAWVFTRSGTTWTQQGSKLVAAGVVVPGSQGDSVGLSADGTTAVVGDYTTNGVWIFKRTGTAWSQAGRLVPTDMSGATPYLGYGAAISADGYTAMGTGPGDTGDDGAGWAFTP